jgi:hypothetical protein
MKVTDFLELAERLALIPSEAELRSAVSRAYYGAFHAALLKLEECGVRLPESAEAHKKACYCLEVVTKPAAVALEELRKKRNEADYRLSSAEYRDPTFVSSQVFAARNCVRIIESLDIRQIRDPVRTYARDVLKYLLIE